MSRSCEEGYEHGPAWHDLGDGEGPPWRVFVHVPASPAPADGWPLLVMTDGNAVIDTAIAAMEIQSAYPNGTNVLPGVIVAIGYPTDGYYDPLRRSIDLSPPPGRDYPPFVEGGPVVRTGGADRLIAYIERTLLPFIEARAPLHATRRTLFGHSFGGLFALYALFEGCRIFDTYVAASPTIYWEDGVLAASEGRFMKRPARPGLSVHLSAGEYEDESLAPFQQEQEDRVERLAQLRLARTAPLARDMAARLGAAGIDTTYETFAGETHMTLIPVAVSRAVGIAFARRS